MQHKPFSKAENQDDRTNQQRVADALMAYLSSFPVVGTGLDDISHFAYTETPIERNLPEDIHIKHYGLYIAVAEIKSRQKAIYTYDFMKKNGVLIDSSRLNNLNPFHRQGKQVLIVTETVDRRIIFTTMQRIHANRKLITTKAEGCLKDDHGEGEKKGTGTVIPLSLHTEIT